PRPRHDDDEAGRQQPGHGTIPTTGVHAVHHSTKPENGAPCLPTMPFLSRFRMVSGGVVSGRGSARASGVVIAAPRRPATSQEPPGGAQGPLPSVIPVHPDRHSASRAPAETPARKAAAAGWG